MMALSAILAACMAAMCALFCRRSLKAPVSAGGCPLAADLSPFMPDVCLQAAACRSCSFQAMVVATSRQAPLHLGQALSMAASSVKSDAGPLHGVRDCSPAGQAV